MEHTCLWAQRSTWLSSAGGEAFAVQHFHGRASYQQGDGQRRAVESAVVL